MKDIRILLGYCPIYGKDISHELVKLDYVSFCYNASEYFCYEEENLQIVNFNQTLGRRALYEKVFDLNRLPALSKDIMEKMLPYESMAIKLAMRKTNFPIVSYEDEKRDYHKHLRFWNYVLEYYKINAVFFEELPHISYTYIIYCLAKIKNIPILLLNMTSVKNKRAIGTSIETMGENIQFFYENVVKNMDIKDCVLTGNVKTFYDKYTSPTEQIKNERQAANFEKKELQRITKYLYGEYIGGKGYIKVLRINAHMLKLVLSGKRDWVWYRKNSRDIYEAKKEYYNILFYNKYTAITQKEYNKIAIDPDYSKRYIYFGLQMFPEETTIPRAGVFSEQYTSIQLLARAAEKVGVMVYVKEHFVQPSREKQVYEMLASIPNVCLINTKTSSFELMENSIAVATQTGTCILEGALRGKPALVTSTGHFWKGLPSAFEIVDEDQGAKIIENILSGFDINQEEIKKYFYAIQESTVECYLQNDCYQQQHLPEHKESVKRIMTILKTFLVED